MKKKNKKPVKQIKNKKILDAMFSLRLLNSSLEAQYELCLFPDKPLKEIVQDFAESMDVENQGTPLKTMLLFYAKELDFYRQRVSQLSQDLGVGLSEINVKWWE